MKKPPDELAKEYGSFIGQELYNARLEIHRDDLETAFKAGYQAGHSQGYEDCREDAVKVCKDSMKEQHDRYDLPGNVMWTGMHICMENIQNLKHPASDASGENK